MVEIIRAFIYLFKNFVVCEYYLWMRIYSYEFINKFAPENRCYHTIGNIFLLDIVNNIVRLAEAIYDLVRGENRCWTSDIYTEKTPNSYVLNTILIREVNICFTLPFENETLIKTLLIHTNSL